MKLHHPFRNVVFLALFSLNAGAQTAYEKLSEKSLLSVSQSTRENEVYQYRMKTLSESNLGFIFSLDSLDRLVKEVSKPVEVKDSRKDIKDSKDIKIVEKKEKELVVPHKIKVLLKACATRVREIKEFDKNGVESLRSENYDVCNTILKTKPIETFDAKNIFKTFIAFKDLREIPDAEKFIIEVKNELEVFSVPIPLIYNKSIKKEYSINSLINKVSETTRAYKSSMKDSSTTLNLGYSFKLSLPSNLKSLENNAPTIMLSLIRKFGKEMEELLEGDTGVSEGYTNVQHIWRVTQIFNEQKKCLNWKDLKTDLINQGIRNPEYFMGVTLAMHDIGKPLAVKAGDKSKQHEYTIPLLQKYMLALGFTQKEVNFATSIVDHEIFGDLLRKRTSIESEVLHIQKLNADAGVDACVFYPIQEMFYASDAGAYPSLYQYVFKRDSNGCVIPSVKDGKVNEIYNRFLQTAYPKQ